MKATTARGIAAQIGRRIADQPAATVAAYRRLRREFSRSLKDVPAATLIGASCLLSQVPRRWHRFVAYELIQRHPTAPGGLDARNLERLGRGMSDWAEVDCFSVYLSGPAWRRRRIGDSVIRGWARSPDRWWRRAALVSTVPLNSRAHGGEGDSRRTLRVCRMLERDRDPMIVKAVSWALRELAKRDPESVRRFLSDRSDALAALVKREVRDKLDTGLKNPGKRRGAR
jgi:3-methyladenine DNA glycosylase AlkD